MKKSILAACLALALLNTIPTVYAADSEQLCFMVPEQKKDFLAPSSGLAVLDDTLEVEELKTYLSSQFAKYNTEIDVTSYKIPFTSESMTALGALISEEMSECFHVDLKKCWGLRGLLVSIEVEYLCNAEEYSEKLAIWQENTNKILSGLSDDSSLSDVQKALLVHDRLAVHCEYDYSSYLAGNVSKQSHDAYGALVNGRAVCSGYAEAYKYLLEKVGIESYICSSDKLDHAWNIVYIDGDYYHVDVTWDDPVWDVSGRVNHNNFMLSSNALFREGHIAYDYDTTPNNTKYDNYFWEKSNTEFQLIDGEIYYIDNDSSQLKKYDGTVLCSVWDRWAANNVASWVGNFSRLSSYNGSLYYSQSKAIYKYDLQENSAKKIYEPKHNFGTYFGIYGFKCSDGNLICELNASPIFMDGTKEKYRMTDIIEPEAPSYVAQIGETRYATLAQAIQAAEAGAVIELLADAEAVTVAKTVTINKNGFNADITAGSDGYTVTETDDTIAVRVKAYPTVSGSIKSFGGGAEVTIELLKGGSIVRTVIVDKMYSLPNVEPDTYTLRISKSEHCTREYELVVVDSDVILDLEVWLYGDVTCDGVVNHIDVLQINRKITNQTSMLNLGTKDLKDYRFKVANVTAINGSDTTLNNLDVLQINRKIARLSSVFDLIG